MIYTTTLNEIKKFNPCAPSWEKLLAGLGKSSADDEPLPYSRILEINGIYDANWSLRTSRKLCVAYAVAAAESAMPIFERRRPGDNRPRECLEAIQAFDRGEITRNQLLKKRLAADAAADADAAAADADDAYAAAAAAAAYAAAYTAAEAYAAAAAADAAADAAAYAAAAAAAEAYAARKKFKEDLFLRVVGSHAND